ncbi:MAG TPA: hypothetical protein VK464_10445 [Symbiobacteriaceae bacterium]|nr:hypothetical protein [Symbiobacteriaceae bacterium]
MTRKMSSWQPLRRMAKTLAVHPSTAFRWRHRLLAELNTQPKPLLTGLVMASEAYVPYSEKGSRRTSGPGSWGARASQTGPTRFRRFIHGKPSCVLVVCAGNQRALVLTSQGRPSVIQLKASFSQLLGTRAKLQAIGLLPYADVCRHLRVPYSEAPHSHGAVDRLRGGFYTWLRQMCGIATRYLPHYLTWFERIAHTARPQPEGGTAPAA